jgi:hypothetical protein
MKKINIPPFENYQLIDNYSDCVLIDQLKINLAGIAIKSPQGTIITGSAASLDENPYPRANYELCERIAIHEARNSTNPFDLYNSNFQKIGTQRSPQIIPTSNDPDNWLYADSNGVAIHKTFKKATENATLELIERDRILRSWYGEYTPLNIPVEKTTRSFLTLQEKLKTKYRLSIQQFSNKKDPLNHISVCGIFAFPKNKTLPFTYGFGSSFNQEKAIEKAKNECIQRIGFLHKSHLSSKTDFSPTPVYHQQFYTQKLGERAISNWLNYGHTNQQDTLCPEYENETIHFVDITPPSYKPFLFVAKTISNWRLPLIYGRNYTLNNRKITPSLMLHPIT